MVKSREGGWPIAILMAVALAALGAGPGLRAAGPSWVWSSDTTIAFNQALIDSLHRVALPAAVNNYSRTVAGTMGRFKRPHVRLKPDAFKWPTRIERDPVGYMVIYGGVRPGPLIYVWVKRSGVADSAWSRFIPN